MGEEDVATEVTAGVEAMGGPDEDVTGVDAEVTAGVEAMVGPDEDVTGVDAAAARGNVARVNAACDDVAEPDATWVVAGVKAGWEEWGHTDALDKGGETDGEDVAG